MTSLPDVPGSSVVVGGCRKGRRGSVKGEGRRGGTGRSPQTSQEVVQETPRVLLLLKKSVTEKISGTETVVIKKFWVESHIYGRTN